MYAYTLFEEYLSQAIRIQLLAHPAKLGVNKQVTYGDVFESESKDDLIYRMVDRELVRLMHEPLGSVLEKLRKDLGFRGISDANDATLCRLSLIRNCVLHNSARADAKLAVSLSLKVGQPIVIEFKTVDEAIHAYREYCAAVDKRLESLVEL